MAEQCLLCVEFCPAGDEPEPPMSGLGSFNNVCPTSVKRAAFIAANARVDDPYFEDFLASDNIIELPELDDLMG